MQSNQSQVDLDYMPGSYHFLSISVLCVRQMFSTEPSFSVVLSLFVQVRILGLLCGLLLHLHVTENRSSGTHCFFGLRQNCIKECLPDI